MHKLIVDTNVLISHCISPLGYSSKIIGHVLTSQNIEWHISSAIFNEYTDVLNRARFSRKYPNFSEASHSLLAIIPKLTFITEPAQFFNIITDSTDNKFLDLAFAANADFIITGNSLDFTIKEFYNTKIVSPQEYWNNHIQL